MSFGPANILLLSMAHAILTMCSLQLVKTLMNEQHKLKVPKKHIRQVFWLSFFPLLNALVVMALLCHCICSVVFGIFKECRKMLVHIDRLQH